MLDLEFINNSAPALSAANLNRIVNEINENEKKIKDVQSVVVEMVVTHGGSIVQANPEAEVEGTLKKISIDGHVFDFYHESEISDWQVSEDYTWSSQHIKDALDEKADESVIPTLAKDVNADDDIWMYTYTDDPDDIVVSDIVIGTTNAIKKLNQNVNTLAARDSDFKASLNGLVKHKTVTFPLNTISYNKHTASGTYYSPHTFVDLGIPTGSILLGCPYISYWTGLTVPMIELRMDNIPEDGVINNSSLLDIVVGALQPTGTQSIRVTIPYI